MTYRIIALLIAFTAAACAQDAELPDDFAPIVVPEVRGDNTGSRTMPVPGEPGTTEAPADSPAATPPAETQPPADALPADTPPDAPADSRVRVALYRQTDAVFATVEDAISVLTDDDAYLSHVGPFDRSAVSGAEGVVTPEEFETSLAGQARAWSADEANRVIASIDRVRPELEQLDLDLPNEVLFVRVDDGFGHPYTRGESVVVPGGMFAQVSDEQLDELMVHEMFHVLSRRDTTLRDDLYDIIGFTPCGELQWPPELADYRITNPDAPVLEHFTSISVNGYSYDVVPITYAGSPYDSATTDVFEYMQFYLLIVETGGGTAVPSRDGQGQLMAFQPQQVPSYYENVGRNTQYVIHPEEVLADNFVFAVLGGDQLPDPEIPAQMLERFRP